MTKRTFSIGDGVDISVAFSAYTPILFRELFPGDDYFRAVDKVMNGEDVLDCYYKFAYTGAYAAAGGDIVPFREWLEQFNIVDFVTILSGIWNFMNESNNRTTSKSKKK